LLSVASVITNGAIICFTMDVITFLSLPARLWIFLGFQWTLFCFQYVLSACVSDVTESVSIQIQRMRFIVSKIIRKEPDEDYDAIRNDPNRFVVPKEEPTVDCCGKPDPFSIYKSKVPEIKDLGKTEPPRLPYPSEDQYVNRVPYPHDLSNYLYPSPIDKSNFDAVRKSLEEAGMLSQASQAGATGAFASSDMGFSGNAYPSSDAYNSSYEMTRQGGEAAVTYAAVPSLEESRPAEYAAVRNNY